MTICGSPRYTLLLPCDHHGQLWAEIVEEHRDLVRAIKAGKPELARSRASDHLTKTARRSMKVDLRTVHAGAGLYDNPADEAPEFYGRHGQLVKARGPKTRCAPVRRQAGVSPTIRLT